MHAYIYIYTSISKAPNFIGFLPQLSNHGLRLPGSSHKHEIVEEGHDLAEYGAEYGSIPMPKKNTRSVINLSRYVVIEYKLV